MRLAQARRGVGWMLPASLLSVSVAVALFIVGGTFVYARGGAPGEPVAWSQTTGSGTVFPACGSASTAQPTCNADGTAQETVSWAFQASANSVFDNADIYLDANHNYISAAPSGSYTFTSLPPNTSYTGTAVENETQTTLDCVGFDSSGGCIGYQPISAPYADTYAISFTTPNCAPPPPAAFNASCSGTAAALTWSPSAGATSYVPVIVTNMPEGCPVGWAEYSENSLYRTCYATTPAGVTKAGATLTAGNWYTGYVYAANSGGWSAVPSGLVVFECVSNPPPTPTNLSAQCYADGQHANLYWNPVTGASSYVVSVTPVDQATCQSPTPNWQWSPNWGGDCYTADWPTTFVTPAGEQAAANFPVTPGITYNFSVAANAPGVTGGSAITSFSCQLPDLTADTMRATGASVGMPKSFSTTIRNIGSDTTAGHGGLSSNDGTFKNFYQVQDPSGAIASYGVLNPPYLTPASIGPLVAGGSQAVSFAYTFPSVGAYLVRVCADNDEKQTNGPDGWITESNENNNCGGWSPVVVTNAIAIANPGSISTSCQDSSDILIQWAPSASTGVSQYYPRVYIPSGSCPPGWKTSPDLAHKGAATCYIGTGAGDGVGLDTSIVFPTTAGDTYNTWVRAGDPMNMTSFPATAFQAAQDNPACNGSPPPAVSCTPSPTSGSTGTLFTYTPVSTGFTSKPSYSWTDANGSPTSGTGATFSTSYSANGSFAALVTAISGPQSATARCSPVTVGSPAPAVSCTPSPTSGSTGTLFTYTPVSTGFTSKPSYSWSDANGSPTSGTGATFSTSYSANGSFAALVTAISGPQSATASCSPVTVGSGGCLDSLNATITASPDRFPVGGGDTHVTYTTDGVQNSCTITETSGAKVTTTPVASSCNLQSASLLPNPQKVTQTTTYCISCDGVTAVGQAGYDCATVQVGGQFQQF